MGYARRNFLVPVPEVSSFQELNELLKERCLAEAKRRLRGERQTIGELWEQERPRLLPLPQRLFPCCRTVPVDTNRLSLVSFQTNRYSVPVECAQHSLFLHAYVDRVEITDGGQVVATHSRCLDPFHYLPLLRQRPGALDHAKPFKKWPHPVVLDQYLAALREQLPHRTATLELIKVLELCRQCSLGEVVGAVEQAMTTRSLGADSVAYFLHAGRNGTQAAPPPCPPVQERDLRQYDLLLRR